MQAWEFALLSWGRELTEVGFTHHDTWRGLSGSEFWDVLRRLGDEGWEMVSSLEDLSGDRSLYWFKRPQQ
ncbi:MAG: hypothetical protein IT307_03905 [Chloroflexi bacterium]|nr:hypothetical protein [Chloroflexota bacterium]